LSKIAGALSRKILQLDGDDFPVCPGNLRSRHRYDETLSIRVRRCVQPWIEREKAEHIKRIVAIAKRGFERIEKVWDENQASSPKEESLAAATLDKHDAIIRRNLGMSETSAGSCSLNLHVLTGGRTIISPQQSIDGIGPVAPEKTISHNPTS